MFRKRRIEEEINYPLDEDSQLFKEALSSPDTSIIVKNGEYSWFLETNKANNTKVKINIDKFRVNKKGDMQLTFKVKALNGRLGYDKS